MRRGGDGWGLMQGRDLTTCVVRKAWDHSVPTRRKAEVGQQRVFEGGMRRGRGREEWLLEERWARLFIRVWRRHKPTRGQEKRG